VGGSAVDATPTLKIPNDVEVNNKLASKKTTTALDVGKARVGEWDDLEDVFRNLGQRR
jgi:hypothetical protein